MFRGSFLIGESALVTLALLTAGGVRNVMFSAR